MSPGKSNSKESKTKSKIAEKQSLPREEKKEKVNKQVELVEKDAPQPIMKKENQYIKEEKKKEKATKEEKKKDYIATIVGVLTLPDDFTNNLKKVDASKINQEENDKALREAVAYRDLRCCIQECINKSPKIENQTDI